ncbi:hypothetical protein F4604DRAFT_1810928 [Suillus subluteus]|nr:hypothetical protein F4604DRAFT_1810928 [Suillus subluteus]
MSRHNIITIQAGCWASWVLCIAVRLLNGHFIVPMAVCISSLCFICHGCVLNESYRLSWRLAAADDDCRADLEADDRNTTSNHGRGKTA